QPVLEEVPALPVLNCDNPNVGIEIGLPLEVGVGFRFRDGVAIKAGLPAPFLARLLQPGRCRAEQRRRAVGSADLDVDRASVLIAPPHQHSRRPLVLAAPQVGLHPHFRLEAHAGATLTTSPRSARSWHGPDAPPRQIPPRSPTAVTYSCTEPSARRGSFLEWPCSKQLRFGALRLTGRNGSQHPVPASHPLLAGSAERWPQRTHASPCWVRRQMAALPEVAQDDLCHLASGWLQS